LVSQIPLSPTYNFRESRTPPKQISKRTNWGGKDKGDMGNLKDFRELFSLTLLVQTPFFFHFVQTLFENN
jgi:hypothetical protein